MTKYEAQWKQAYYYIEPGKTKIKDYEPLFELAYKKLAGNWEKRTYQFTWQVLRCRSTPAGDFGD